MFVNLIVEYWVEYCFCQITSPIEFILDRNTIESYELEARPVEISNKVINYLNTQMSFRRELAKANVCLFVCCIKIRNKVANSRRNDA